jgi:predicted GNAT family acetyltransferase
MLDGVIHNPAMRRWELPLGDMVAAIYYRADEDPVTLTHTEVPNEYSGQGIASRLARAVFEELRSSGRRAIVKCPFLSAYVAKHPEYSDLVAG